MYLIDISKIGMPEIRVTSTFSPEQTVELIESLKSEGQKDPVKLLWIDNSLVLADGLNRILGLKSLGVDSVKALIVTGSIRDAQIANIITARHRGKENPAQTAEVIADLVDKEHMPESEVISRLGLTKSTFRRLLAIARLPDEVKDHIKYGRLGVGSAYHISQIGNAAAQIDLATKGVTYGYTEDVYKAAVTQILNPDDGPKQQAYVFEPTGQFNRPEIHCMSCDGVLTDRIFPINCCANCFEQLLPVIQKNMRGQPEPESAATDTRY